MQRIIRSQLNKSILKFQHRKKIRTKIGIVLQIVPAGLGKQAFKQMQTFLDFFGNLRRPLFLDIYRRGSGRSIHDFRFVAALDQHLGGGHIKPGQNLRTMGIKKLLEGKIFRRNIPQHQDRGRESPCPECSTTLPLPRKPGAAGSSGSEGTKSLIRQA